ncbi:signal peptidase I [Nocardioides rubriscoriae]|uniref:signal peptidase I n=1 Tax=Nocardioides rubriscoriae TaxID=642762 RepID=UPI001FE66FF7|nr:signal peptidase I [Nocardioides rubriscoriae]
MTTDDDRLTPDGGEGPVSTASQDESGTTDQHDATDGAGDTAAPRRRLPVWQESLVLVAAAVVVAVVIKALFVQAFYIPSSSMEPGLVENDRILVQKVSYWFGGSPSRGDVVVFEDPGGWLGNTSDDGQGPVEDLLSTIGLYPEGGHLVKRVIGVEGDVITCCDDQGRIMVNGKPLDEGDYIAPRGEDVECNGPMIPCDPGWSAGPVPAGKVFVMGDNRADSADSTVHLCLPDEVDCNRDPFVDVDLVVGKVFAVAWPLSHLGFVGRPDAVEDVPDAADAG